MNAGSEPDSTVRTRGPERPGDDDITEAVPVLGGSTGEVPDRGSDPGAGTGAGLGAGIDDGAGVGAIEHTGEVPEPRDPRRWTGGDVLALLIRPLLLWLAGRGATLALAAMATPLNRATRRDLIGRLALSAGYVDAATNGYTNPLPPGPKGVGPSAAEFFPGFPALIGLVTRYGQVSPLVAGLIVSLVGGLLATVVVWATARAYLGERGAGDRAAALFSFAPGALLLGVVDPAGLFVVVAGLALWAMGRERFVVAGVLTALAWFVHPAALVLTAVLLVAALAAAFRGKGAGLAGATVALLGAAGTVATFWLLTGSPLAWINTQIDAAAGGFWPTATTEKLQRFIAHPGDMGTYGAVLGVGFGAVGLLSMISRRLSPVFGLYALAVGALAYFLLPLGLGPTALLLAFPLVLGLARLRSVPFALLLAATVVASGLVTYLTVRGGPTLL